MGKLVEEATCPCCLEIFTNPQSLICGHNVCLACIPNTTTQGNNKQVRCTLCNSVTLEDKIKPNVTLANTVEQLKQGKVNEKHTCGRCSQEAILECLDCLRSELYYLCGGCSDLIHGGGLKSHRTGPLNSFKIEQSQRCLTHQKKLSLLCEDDLELICSHCMLDGHHGHKISPVGTAAKSMKPKINEHIGGVTKRKQQLQEAIRVINNTVNLLAMERPELETKIRSSFDEIRKLLAAQEQSLNEEVADAFKFQNAVELRSRLMSQLASINECMLFKSSLDSLGDLSAIKFVCLLMKMEKDSAIPIWETLSLGFELSLESVFSSIKQLNLAKKTVRYKPDGTKVGFGDGSDGELVVTGLTELDPSRVFNFTTVIVKQGAVLSVSRVSPLRILVQDAVLIEQGGSINLNAKGYLGGAAVQPVPTGNGIAHQGSSYDSQPTSKKEANRGGGGGGEGNYNFGSTGGGGGGYGTPGQNAAVNNYGGGNYPGGFGGGVYGDSMVVSLHLGSGGGSGHPYTTSTGGKGGNGGGALILSAQKIQNQGKISCDGENGESSAGQNGSGGGGGSGGSIHLRAHEFSNAGTISAIGGTGGTNTTSNSNTTSKGGAGGVGRIRIDTSPNPTLGSINPHPGHISVLEH